MTPETLLKNIADSVGKDSPQYKSALNQLAKSAAKEQSLKSKSDTPNEVPTKKNIWADADQKCKRKAELKQTEQAFQDSVIALARLHRYRVKHTHKVKLANDEYRTPTTKDKGFPDLLLARPDQTLFAELKVGRNKPSEDQIIWLNLLALSGQKVFLWYPEHFGEIEMILKNEIVYEDCVSRWMA